ncbi:MAG: serine/threonine-protein kinase [Nannocystaceae bacterium]
MGGDGGDERRGASSLGDTDRGELGLAETAAGQVAVGSPLDDGDFELRRLKELARAKLFGGAPAVARIGRFRVLDRLGAGGMGIVYTAYDERLDRKVAVKVLRHQGSSSPAARARILREAKAMARLAHPNVVAVHEVGDHEDAIFIAMEFVRGESLEKWTAGERSWREVLAAYVAAGAGLRAAHRAGIVHRDFKPHNVIRGNDGPVKVLDFGLAQASIAEVDERVEDRQEVGEARPSAGYNRLTHTGALVGTPAYMSPEQFSGEPATELSDQFSFCVALYEGLYGQLPFAGASFASLSAEVLSGRVRPPPPSSTVPGWVGRVLRRGLAVDPGARFPGMSELLRALSEDPRTRRRRWFAVGGLAAAMGLGGYAAAVLPAAQRCDVGEDAVGRLWSAARQEAIAAAYAGAAGPLGASAWERARPRLDAYVRELAAAREQACVSHRDGDASDTLYERQSACLDRREAGLDALMRAFDSPTREIVERSASAISGLLDLGYCGDRDALLADVPPPENADDRRTVEAARRDLERARADELLGAAARASEQADAVLARAEAIGYGPLIAESWLRLGAAQQELRDGEAAFEAMTRALHAALRSRHAGVAAEAAARQLFIESDLLLRPEEALTAVDLAQALGDAAPDPWRAWLLANNTGIARWAADDPQGALREYERALAALADDASASYERSITEGNVGLALALNGQCVAALPRFEAALRDTTALVGDRHPSTARAALQIGSCLVGAGRLEAARRRLGEAIAALPDDYDELADWITWTMARELVARRWYAAARLLLDERLGKRLARHAGPVDADHAFYALTGIAAAGEGDFEAGWIAVEAAVDTIPASDAIELLVLLGDVLGDQGDYEGAARAFARAVEAGDRAHLQGLSLPARVGLVDASLAKGERAAATESLAAAEEALAARPELGSEIVAAQVRRARGDLLLDAGSADAALQAHVSALELLAGTDPEFGPRLDAEASVLRSRVAAQGRSAGAAAAEEALIERYAAGGPGFAVDASRLREGLAAGVGDR